MEVIADDNQAPNRVVLCVVLGVVCFCCIRIFLGACDIYSRIANQIFDRQLIIPFLKDLDVFDHCVGMLAHHALGSDSVAALDSLIDYFVLRVTNLQPEQAALNTFRS